jgi:hypothetical protein
LAIANNATPVVHARMEAAHNVHLADYASFEAAKRVVIKFKPDAIDEIWYKDLTPGCFITLSLPRRFSPTLTLILGGIEEACIGVGSKDHVAGTVGCAVGGVRCDIVEQLVNIEFSILCSLCLLGASGAEGHKELVVNCPSIV